jgi:hypothetical protein
MFILAQMLAAGEGVPRHAARPRLAGSGGGSGLSGSAAGLALEEPDPQRAALLMKRAAHALGHRAHG